MTAIAENLDLIPAEEFVARLEAARQRHSVTTTPFIQAIVDGSAPRSAIERWSLEWHHLTLRTAPPSVRTPYLYRTQSAEVLEHAVDNALGEVGYLADAPHPDLAREMCYGLGLTDADIERYVPTPLMLWYMSFAYLSSKGQALGVPDRRVNTAVGMVIEGDASATAMLLVDGLREHYALDDRACSYWIVHGYADAGHAQEGAEMTVAMCDSRELQEMALGVAERAIRTRNLLWSSWSEFL